MSLFAAAINDGSASLTLSTIVDDFKMMIQCWKEGLRCFTRGGNVCGYGKHSGRW